MVEVVIDRRALDSFSEQKILDNLKAGLNGGHSSPELLAALAYVQWQRPPTLGHAKENLIAAVEMLDDALIAARTGGRLQRRAAERELVQRASLMAIYRDLLLYEQASNMALNRSKYFTSASLLSNCLVDKLYAAKHDEDLAGDVDDLFDELLPDVESADFSRALQAAFCLKLLEESASAGSKVSKVLAKQRPRVAEVTQKVTRT